MDLIEYHPSATNFLHRDARHTIRLTRPDRGTQPGDSQSYC